MKKLALYLKTRLDSCIEVGVVEKGEEPPRQEDDVLTVWIGSEEFVDRMAGSGQEINRIILDDEETEEEGHIFRFRSCERIYRDIRKKCLDFGFYPQKVVRGRKQTWYAVTTDGAVGGLLAFSLTLARILSSRERVLFVSFTECSGMRQLFYLDPDPDLSDLILELRKDETSSPEAFAGRLGPFDYLLAPENPMILHEINGEDIERLLRAIGGCGTYGSVVFAVGTSVCGSSQIFSAAGRIIHLTDQGLLHECARDARLAFVRRCVKGDVQVKQIRVPEICVKNQGEELIEDWLEEPVGRAARSCLMEDEEKRGLQDGEEESYDKRLAGDQGQTVW